MTGRPCQTRIGLGSDRRRQISVYACSLTSTVTAIVGIESISMGRPSGHATQLPGCVHYRPPQIPARDCNLTVLASVAEHPVSGSADRGGIGQGKKRFPLAFKTLMVTPLCSPAR